MTDHERRRAQWREAKRRARAGEPYVRPEVAQCGTESGAKRHRRNGETPCPECLAAANAARWPERAAKRET